MENKIKNKISFKQIMPYALACLSCFALAPRKYESSQILPPGQILTPETIKAKHERYVRMHISSHSESSESLNQELSDYLESAMKRNHLEHWYSHKGSNQIELGISYRRGSKVLFRFTGKPSPTVALSLVVLDLLPTLFQNVETQLDKRTLGLLKKPGRFANIYHYSNVNRNDFMNLYFIAFDMFRLVRVNLCLKTDAFMKPCLPTYEEDMPPTNLLQSMIYESIKARYEEDVQACMFGDKTGGNLSDYVKTLIKENELTFRHDYKRKGELTISHRLGQVFFTFRDRQSRISALSHIVLNLFSELFGDFAMQLDPEQLSLLKETGNLINIYNEDGVGRDFIAPYVTRLGMPTLERVDLRFKPDVIATEEASGSTSSQPEVPVFLSHTSQIASERDMHLTYMQEQALLAYGLYAHPVEHTVVESFENEGEFDPITRLGIVYGDGVLVFEFKGTLTQQEALSDLNLESLPELFTQNGKDLVEFGVLRHPNSFCDNSRINKVELFMEPSSPSLPLMLQ